MKDDIDCIKQHEGAVLEFHRFCSANPEINGRRILHYDRRRTHIHPDVLPAEENAGAGMPSGAVVGGLPGDMVGAGKGNDRRP